MLIIAFIMALCSTGRLDDEKRRTVPGSVSGTALSLNVLDIVPVRRASAFGSSAAIPTVFNVDATSMAFMGGRAAGSGGALYRRRRLSS